MSKPKLAYLCGPLSWGGLEMNQLRNAVWMKARGHEVVVFAQRESAIAKEAKQLGVSVINIGAHKKYYDLSSARKLAKLIRVNEVSHLIVRSPLDMGVASLTKTLIGAKLHLSYFMEMQIGVSKRDILHTIRYSRFDVWSCPLPWLEDQVKSLTKFSHHKIHQIPSGLDLAPFTSLPNQSAAREELGLPLELPLFGLIGRFDLQKGQLRVLKAFNEFLQRSDSPIGLVLLGEKTNNEADDYYNEMIDFIAQNKLSDKVYILPFRKDIQTFYGAIDYFIMASLHETFGMVTIEAMASGKKIIGSNTGGTPEILHQGELGKLFSPESHDELTTVLLESISKNDFPSVEVLQKEAAKYDYNTVCAQVENVLNINFSAE